MYRLFVANRNCSSWSRRPWARRRKATATTHARMGTYAGRIAVLLCVALAACQSATLLGPAEMPRYRLIDLTDEYTAFYDRTEGFEDAARVAAFNAEIAPLFPRFYRAGRSGAPPTQELFNSRVARSFAAFPQQRESYGFAAANFRAALDTSISRFQQEFPDAADLGDIYLVHSLGEMDGGMRDIDGEIYFIFGADVMALYHPPGEEEPFFGHELFHRYHSRSFPGCEQLWCGIWAEGLAVLAAERLYPGADDKQLLLSIPEPLRPAVERDLREAVCAIVERLDSTAAEDWTAILSLGDVRLADRLPPRFGYYVGYLAAREAARTHPLPTLAHMDVIAARPALEGALARLADCESKPSPAA